MCIAARVLEAPQLPKDLILIHARHIDKEQFHEQEEIKFHESFRKVVFQVVCKHNADKVKILTFVVQLQWYTIIRT